MNHIKLLKMLLLQLFQLAYRFCIFRRLLILLLYCSDWAKVGWKVPAVRPFTRRSSRPPLSGHCCRLNGIMCIRKVSESELKITFTSGWLPLPHVNPDWPASMHSLLPQPWLELFPPQALCPFMKNWFHLTHISAHILPFCYISKNVCLINSRRCFFLSLLLSEHDRIQAFGELMNDWN